MSDKKTEIVLVEKSGGVVVDSFTKIIIVESFTKVVLVGSFTDQRDGHTYPTVKIGNHTWFAENLNYKTSNSMYYNRDPENGKRYGQLYTWQDAKDNCPEGWHLPSREEWADLVEFVGGAENAGTKLKSTTGWNEDGNGTDEFGFSALPGGNNDAHNTFNKAYSSGWWWIDNDKTPKGNNYAYSVHMHIEQMDKGKKYSHAKLYLDNYFEKKWLYSVRCVRDA